MINMERLKDIREDHDLTQNEMASIIGAKRSAYSLWELGINIIPLNYLCKFADYFNYSLDYVLGLTNDKNENNIQKGLDLYILGENIRKLRKQKNLSQENIANILNVTQACINHYENGKILISTSNLYKLSKRFKIELFKLCGKEKKKDKVTN